MASSLTLRRSKGKQVYYAVSIGRQTGVFESWDEAKAATEGVSGAAFKKFATREEAQAFVEGADFGYPSSSATETVVYTDASFAELGRGGIGMHWAGLDGQPDVAERVRPCSSSYEVELCAAIRALQIDPRPQLPLTIYSDNEAVTKAFNEYLPDWKKREFRRVKQKELTQLALKYIENRTPPVNFRFVFAHANNTYNHVADKLARQGAEKGEDEVRDFEADLQRAKLEAR